MADHLSHIKDAAAALGGIGDLLMFAWKAEGRDMHGVDPEKLFYLIDVVRRQIDVACDDIELEQAMADKSSRSG